MKKKPTTVSHTPKLQKKQIQPAHCASLGSTGDEEEPSVLEAKIHTLEQRQRNMANYYQNKINELAEVLNQQTNTKQELTQQFMELVKLSQKQKEYVSTLKGRLFDEPQAQPNKVHKEQVENAYLVGHFDRRKDEGGRHNSKSRGLLFRSGPLKTTLLKQSKSQHDLESEYFPKSSTRLPQRNYERVFGESQRRNNPTSNY